MGLIDIIKNIISGGKKIDIKRLPSQGYFYPIDFEIKLLRECATRLNATNDEVENEISKIKGLFNHCSTAEDVLDTICEKDFCCGYEDWLYEDLLGNIKGLIKE